VGTSPESDWDDDHIEPEPRRWAAQEVAELVARYPVLSPVRVLGVQVVVGLLLAMLSWLLTQRINVVASVLYGAAAVVVPGLFLTFGMRRRPRTAAGAQMRFLFWTIVKLGMACAMLAGATRIVPNLSWPALLLALVMCLKVYAWALLWQRRIMKKNA
jgi:ATP synthase protein I